MEFLHRVIDIFGGGLGWQPVSHQLDTYCINVNYINYYIILFVKNHRLRRSVPHDSWHTEVWGDNFLRGEFDK